MNKRMLGRAMHSDYFCMYGRKCKCERGHRVRPTDTDKSRRQIRRREQQQLERTWAGEYDSPVECCPICGARYGKGFSDCRNEH